MKDHDWVKKKHPVSAPPVTVTPRDPTNDPMMSTSVIPYLIDLHYGNAADQGGGDPSDPMAAGSQEDFITEHEVNRLERARAASAEAQAHTKTSLQQSNSSRKDTKTTRCIKVRKISGCNIA